MYNTGAFKKAKGTLKLRKGCLNSSISPHPPVIFVHSEAEVMELAHTLRHEKRGVRACGAHVVATQHTTLFLDSREPLLVGLKEKKW